MTSALNKLIIMGEWNIFSSFFHLTNYSYSLKSSRLDQCLVGGSKCLLPFLYMNTSRSEQAPGSEFHPCDESGKIDCGCLGPC